MAEQNNEAKEVYHRAESPAPAPAPPALPHTSLRADNEELIEFSSCQPAHEKMDPKNPEMVSDIFRSC